MPLQRGPWDSGVSNLAKGRGGNLKDKGSSKYKWQRASSSREGRQWTAFFLGWWFCRLRSVRCIKLSLVLDVTQMYYTYVYSFTWFCFPPCKTLYALISRNAVMGWGRVLLSPLQNWETKAEPQQSDLLTSCVCPSWAEQETPFSLGASDGTPVWMRYW